MSVDLIFSISYLLNFYFLQRPATGNQWIEYPASRIELKGFFSTAGFRGDL